MVIRKYLDIYINLQKISLARRMEYRLDFLLDLIGIVIGFVSYLVFIDVIFANFSDVGGWSKQEIIFLFGVYLFTFSLFDALVFANIRTLSRKIVRGELDMLLAKPIATLFLVAVENFHIFSFSRSLLGLGIAIYSLGAVDITLSLAVILQLIVALLLTFVMFSSLLLSFFAMAFWVGDISHGYWVFHEVSRIGRLPISVFSGGSRMFFVFILPVVFFGAIPTGMMLGKIGIEYLWIGLVITLIWLWVAAFIWKKGLNSYISAGG